MITKPQPVNEYAVSPVIAVILMVAITVILAALVASVTMGMTTNIPKTKVLSATVSQPESDKLTITYFGGQDQTTCIGIRWDITDSFGSNQMTMMGHTTSPSIQLQVGEVRTITGNFIGKDHVVATAYFMDGTQQVILDNTI